MSRTLALSLILLTGCVSVTTRPVPVPTAPPTPAAQAPAAPCVPGNALINATLWTQTAAEYRASALQTYAAARRMLDAALADPTWTAEPQQTSPFAAKPPAVILDADETVIDNSAFEARVIRQGKPFDSAMWKAWVEEAAAAAIPGAGEFLAYAKSRGVTPFYVTNRDHDEEPATRRNLEKLGYPLGAEDTLLTRGERPEWTSDKGSRRAHVAANYRVLLLVGDDLNDFANAREASRAEREQIIADNAGRWGTQWFMLPNAMYGSWERAAIGSTSRVPPCDVLQKKIDTLRP